MSHCRGCLKEGPETFCGPCRKRLFDGTRVPQVLLFSRSVYDETRRALTPGRLSISGVQTKMSVVLRDGRLELTEAGGRYLLKPILRAEIRRAEAVPVNEHLTMQIARQVFKIAVAECALVAFADGEPAYLVRRFDVQRDGSKSLQEDFAQLANRSAETHGANYKYDGSYEEIGELIRRHVAAYPVALERFFQRVAFNYLVHNGDAHLKNFSLIRNDQYGDYSLTPAYDLLNTRLHVPDESRTALPLFKDDFQTESFRANAFYAYDDFHELAKRLGLREARARRILRAFVDKVDAVIALIERSQLSDECKELYRGHVRDSVRALSHSHGGLVG
jgi:serine/threonine-protein kinase HipA